MHCKKIQKKHIRKLRQKERLFYRNLHKSGRNEKNYIRCRKSYFSLYVEIRNKKKSISRNKRNVKKIKIDFNRDSIVLPDSIDFYKDENRNITIQTLSDIYSFPKPSILIDFKEVHFMSATATSMLFSTIKHIQSNLNKQVNIKLPKSKKIIAILKQIGLLDFLNIQTSIDVSKYEDVYCWHAKDGHELPDPASIKEIVDEIIEHSKNNNIDITQYRKKINTTLGETILNVIDHAYLDSNLQYQNWVFFTRILKRNKTDKLSLIACDSGIGMVATFKKYVDKTKFEKVQKFFKTDNDYIKEAVMNLYNVSRKGKTNQKRKRGRGTGLKKIYDKSVEMPDSVFRIYSHRGFFCSNKNSVKSKFKGSIPGTVIELIIPLNEQHEK